MGLTGSDTSTYKAGWLSVSAALFKMHFPTFSTCATAYYFIYCTRVFLLGGKVHLAILTLKITDTITTYITFCWGTSSVLNPREECQLPPTEASGYALIEGSDLFKYRVMKSSLNLSWSGWGGNHESETKQALESKNLFLLPFILVLLQCNSTDLILIFICARRDTGPRYLSYPGKQIIERWLVLGYAQSSIKQKC